MGQPHSKKEQPLFRGWTFLLPPQQVVYEKSIEQRGGTVLKQPVLLVKSPTSKWCFELTPTTWLDHRMLLPELQQSEHQPIVQELIVLLKKRPDLTRALVASLERAGYSKLDYLRFLDDLIISPPEDERVTNMYRALSFSPNNLLEKDADFQRWLVRFVRARGEFLDSTASAGAIEAARQNPDFHLDDYFVNPSGWLTYNQFFTREVKPGRRPIDHLCDDRILVFPADSRYLGQWAIDEEQNNIVNVKGTKLSIRTLLADSAFAKAFEGGIFTHSYLSPLDYHRFHVPHRGVVLEAKHIEGRVWADVEGKEVQDSTGFQFTQMRGLVVLDTPIGLVAILPIGMDHVSSVNILAEPNVTLHKGELFGYFAYGASDIIMLFQKDKIRISATVGQHYLQGQKFGESAVSQYHR